jgi:fructokinase
VIGNKPFDIVALGELLIDFTDAGLSPAGQRLYEQNPGGAPANVLCAAARLGMKTGFIGKVGADMQGRFLCGALVKEGIDVSGLVMSETESTTLAFVNIGKKGEREFSFCRKPGADTCLRWTELNEKLLNSCRIFHFGSLSMTDEPSRGATIAAVRAAGESGAIISYDPNYRAPLWPGKDMARRMMLYVLPLVDILKLSAEEARLLTGQIGAMAAFRALTSMTGACVVMTMGADGAICACGGKTVEVPGFSAGKAVDTTGAGDAFCGALLSRICHDSIGSDIGEDIRFANAAAALCVTKRGGIPAMPYLDEVELLLQTGAL